MSFFPDTFYRDLGLPLAPVAAMLETFFRRQSTIFGDIECNVTGEKKPQYHVMLRLANRSTVKVLTFPQSTDPHNIPDIQFGALAAALPRLDLQAYRSEALRRLGNLVAEEASKDHRFVKFSYEMLHDPSHRDRASAAFEWLLTQLRIAAGSP
jgi:hypothetical protein